MQTRFNSAFLVVALLIAGCAYETETNVLVVGDDLTPELQEVQQVFNSIESKEDRLIIHKLFAGGGDYLSACESIDSTAKFDPILGRVQSSYGWDREKYPELTDAVSEYLISVGYDQPKELKSNRDRKEFAKIFQDLAGATKYE